MYTAKVNICYQAVDAENSSALEFRMKRLQQVFMDVQIHYFYPLIFLRNVRLA